MSEPEVQPEAGEAETDRAYADLERRLKVVSKAYAELQEEWGAYRKRAEAAAAFRQEQMIFQLVAAFLDPLDNLKRSIDAGPANGVALIEACRMVHGQFHAELTKLGLQPVPGVGSAFDPARHEAIAQVPVADAAQNDVVVAVVADGWVMGTRTVRAARVVTGKYETPAEG